MFLPISKLTSGISSAPSGLRRRVLMSGISGVQSPA